MEYKPVKISNIVVSGSLNTEVDLKSVGEENLEDWTIDKKPHPLQLELQYKDYSQINCHRSGKYIIRSKSKKELQLVNKKFVMLFVDDFGLIESPEQAEFSIKNIVGTITMDSNIDLDKLSRENPQAQYEPETFSALMVDSDFYSASIFHTGKITIQGAESKEKLQEASEEIQDYVMDSLRDDDGSNSLL